MTFIVISCQQYLQQIWRANILGLGSETKVGLSQLNSDDNKTGTPSLPSCPMMLDKARTKTTIFALRRNGIGMREDI